MKDADIRDLFSLLMPNGYRALMKTTEVDGPEFKSEQAGSDDAAGIGQHNRIARIGYGEEMSTQYVTIVLSRTKPEAQEFARQHGVPGEWGFGATRPDLLEGVLATEILIDKSAAIPNKTMAVIHRLRGIANGTIPYV